jgi:hypothetical protein
VDGRNDEEAELGRLCKTNHILKELERKLEAVENQLVRQLQVCLMQLMQLKV